MGLYETTARITGVWHNQTGAHSRTQRRTIVPQPDYRQRDRLVEHEIKPAANDGRKVRVKVPGLDIIGVWGL
jgi:hypothetical protein